VTALLIPVVFGACATKGDIAELTSSVDGLRAQSARTDSVLTALAVDIDRLQDTVRTAQGEQLNTRGSMARELRRIDERLTRIEQLVGLIQQQVNRLEERRAAGPPPDVEHIPTSERPDTLRGERLRGDTGMAEPTQGGDPDAIFEIGLRQFQNGALTTAQTAFSRFVQMAPNHPRAPEAWFNLGDIHQQRGELDEAVAAFLRVHEFYPGSDQVPMALYRAGAVEHERGDDEAAREHLQRVVNSFPESEVAALARELLQEIG